MKQRIRIHIDDGVADIRLNRPDKMNALDPAMFSAIADAGARLKDDPTVRAVVLSGEGRAFSAGLDVERMMAATRGKSILPFADLTKRTHGVANFAQHIVWLWRKLPVPVIAAVHGVAVGGGFQLALGADIRYVAPGTRLAAIETTWGLVPDMAGTQLMRSSGARRCCPRTDVHRTDLLSRRSVGLRVRHARDARSADRRHGHGERNRRQKSRRDPRRQAAAKSGRGKRSRRRSGGGDRRAGRTAWPAEPC